MYLIEINPNENIFQTFAMLSLVKVLAVMNLLLGATCVLNYVYYF